MSESPLNGHVYAPHRAAFFRSWMEDPFQVASIAPSGRMLAQRMTDGIAPGRTVIELGAGTGTITDAIRSRGVADADLHLIELNDRFADILGQRFPSAAVHRVNAATIESVLPDLVGQVDCIVSGLPILWFGRKTKASILSAAFAMLRPGGFINQMTYWGRPPVSGSLRRELGFSASLVGVAPLNLPPAFVFRFRKEVHP